MAVPQTPDPASIVAYWVEEVGPKGWYLGSDTLDAAIREYVREYLLPDRRLGE